MRQTTDVGWRRQSVPLMAALHGRLQEIRQQIPPGGKRPKCDYALRQWIRVEKYLDDGRVETDNNACEGGVRSLALGGKKWLHIGSPQAGPKNCRRRFHCRDLPASGHQLAPPSAGRADQTGGVAHPPRGELTPAAWKAAQQHAS